MLIEKLLCAITFHYDEERLRFLHRVCKQIPNLGYEVKVLIITNASDQSCEKINQSLDFLKNFEICNFTVIGHPYFLTWGYLPIFKEYFLGDSGFTHFMYLEDDIEVKPSNINYWLRARYELIEFGLYPSFIRFEVNEEDYIQRATDITKPLSLKKIPKYLISSSYGFISSPQPYQGMFLMDRSMMGEFFNSPACSPDFGSWGIREKANQGLTFVNVKKPFFSRNLIGYDFSKKLIDSGALIYHMPCNYANNPSSPFGKIPITELVL